MSIRVDHRTTIKGRQIGWLQRRLGEELAPLVDIVCRKSRDNGSHQFAAIISRDPQGPRIETSSPITTLKELAVRMEYEAMRYWLIQVNGRLESDIPELIADAVCNAQIWQFFHDLDCGGIHQIQCATVIGLHEAIVVGESRYVSIVYRIEWRPGSICTGGDICTERCFQHRAVHTTEKTHLWNPRPSMRTTIHVLGSSTSGCSKFLTYSNLGIL